MNEVERDQLLSRRPETVGRLEARPAWKPEEGEPGSGDWWTLVQAILAGVVVIMLIGWIISA